MPYKTHGPPECSNREETKFFGECRVFTVWVLRVERLPCDFGDTMLACIHADSTQKMGALDARTDGANEGRVFVKSPSAARSL